MNSVDDREIRARAEITQHDPGDVLRQAVRGQAERYKDWCEHVDE